MATVLEVVESLHEASYSVDLLTGEINATRVFKIEYDEQVALWYPIQNRAGWGGPSNGALLPDHTTVRLSKLSPDYAGGYSTMIVTAEYSTVQWESSPVGFVSIKWSGRSEDEEYFIDVDDNLAINTAGYPLVERPKRRAPKGTASMVKYVAASSTFADFAPMLRRINSGTVTIDGTSCADGTIFIDSVELSDVITGGVSNYRELTVTALYDDRGWDQSIQSRGFKDKDGVEITDGDPEEKVSEPWPLDADGNKCATSSTVPATVDLVPYFRVSMGGLFA